MNKIVLRLIVVYACLVCFRTAVAQTWFHATNAPDANWTGIACSADGNKLVAVTGEGFIYLSTDSGGTWTLNTNGALNLGFSQAAVASSADGSKLVAAFFGWVIYASEDSGKNWNISNPDVRYWTSIASSSDGMKLVATVNGGGLIYVSTNAGNTWKPSGAPGRDWNCVASSADGDKLVASSLDYLPYWSGAVYTSVDSGAGWTQVAGLPGTNWGVVASSADGSRLAAAVGDGASGGIYLSGDSGNNWVQAAGAPNQTWFAVASSANGRTLVAAPNLGPIYTSMDYGVTWGTNNTPSGYWRSAAASADGSVLAAGIETAGIYTSVSAPAIVLNLSASGGKALLSWTIPSKQLALQESSNLTSWISVTNIPVLDPTNLQNQVFLPMAKGSRFYRLAPP